LELCRVPQANAGVRIPQPHSGETVTVEYLTNLPDSNEVWKGIGGHFDSLGQIVSEFVDNSVANIIACNPTNRSIALRFVDEGHAVRVTIEDTGSGIGNLSNAFRLGGKEGQDNPLNEHGFGMKHALASANPTNDGWIVCTRTAEDVEQGVYKRIESPYLIQQLPVSTIEQHEAQWPGQYMGAGTFIEFTCSRGMFNTLRAGISGNPAFGTCVGYLIEDLGFVYAGLIQRNMASFMVSWESDNNQDSQTVAAVTPNWEQYYRPPGEGVEEFDLGEGKVELKFAFGAMQESDYKRYYKKNMSSSGLEIRINGRVLAHNVFKDVWHIEKHNIYNHLLVIVDIVSADPARLPATRTSKNGLRQGDRLLEALYTWVRRHMPTPPKRIQDDPVERDLFEELLNRKKFHVPDPKTVLTEQHVYQTIGEKVRVDMYLAYNDSVILYEGKKKKTAVQDVYQLKMYWDGAALDGLGPTEGVLIASEHPDSVTIMVNHLNQMSDINGNTYNFKTKIWRDEGIEYSSV
jgi:hypothetical protein